MLKQFVDASSLSCILNEDYDSEPIPEPFRMQRAVSFHVTYSEYINYLLSLQQDSGIVLVRDIKTLRNLAMEKNQNLYKYFLQDVAFGILKELSYAEQYARPATIILPASLNGNNVDAELCLAAFEHYKDFTAECKARVLQAGFKLPKTYRDENISLFKLAIVLYAFGKVSVSSKEVNIVYDATTF